MLDFELLYSDDFMDDLNELSSSQATKIMEKLKQMQQGLKVDVKKLQGRNDYRLRVGGYRVLFTKTNNVIDVQRIMLRKNAYN
jgi:mRNA interferase RelE/StbE